MHTTLYNLAGTLNAALVLLSLLGIFSQIRTIRLRKANPAISAKTQRLSLNQFISSYFSYFAVFVYGYSIMPFNHYLVWSRLIACLLMLVIFYEIWHDRRTTLARTVLAITLGALMLGILGLMFGGRFSDEGRHVSTALILINALILSQGGAHQIRVILRAGDTGALDLRMNQFIFITHGSTILFALVMGLHSGWPLLVLALTGGGAKGIVMYLFRWVRVSETARQRRGLAGLA